MRHLGFILCAGLCLATSCGFATPTIDRRASVEAAYRLFPWVLDVISESSAFKALPPDERDIFKRVARVVRTTDNPLQFNDQAGEFNLNSDESQRWMRSDIGGAGPIEVNLQMLNRPDVEDGLPLLMKTLFHEYAHKIGPSDWSLRDHVAQVVEEQSALFYHALTLDDVTGKAHLKLFSIPNSKIQRELQQTSVNRPQPTNAVLLEREGHTTDLTEPLLLALESASPLVRSLLLDANRFAMMAVQQLMTDGMKDVDPIFWPLLDRMKADMEKPLKESRVLEIQDATSSGQLVRLQAVWETTRKSPLPPEMKFDGLDFLDRLPIPVTILLRLPNDSL